MNLELLENIISRGVQNYESDPKHDRVYKIHKYWSRKPWHSISDLINKYSKEGDTVCDPFLGSGVMALESILNNRNFKGYDINPISLFIAETTLDFNYKQSKMLDDYEKVKAFVRENISPLYASSNTCPNCGNHLTYKYLNDGKKFTTTNGRLFCEECKYEDKKNHYELTDKDLKLLKLINEYEVKEWIPSICFPKKFYKDRFSYKGVSKITDLHTKRNLVALARLRHEIDTGDYNYPNLLLISFSNTILHVSKLKGQNVRPLGVNNYWIPDDHIEENVGFRFLDRLNITINSKKSLQSLIKDKSLGNAEIDKKSALLNNGILFDYIITDPPYGEAIQYSELSYVWNGWLKEEMQIEDEIIVNPVQNKGDTEFHLLLNKSLEVIYSSLKPNKYFTLCFQNKDLNTWVVIINECKKLGFELVDVQVYDNLGSTFNNNWASFSPKSDIYVTFQKKRLKSKQKATISDLCEEVDFNETINKILIHCKTHHTDLYKQNFLYDVIVSYLIWYIYSCEGDISVSLSLKDVIKNFSENKNEDKV